VRMKAGPVGIRGLALLAAAGIAGLILGMHGWSARRTGLAASAAGGLGARSATAPPHRTAGPRPSASPGTAASPAPSGTAAPSPGGTGPLLRSEPYASYAYQVWPGTPGTAARQAMTGLAISVSRQSGGITVRAGANGQPPTAHTYRGGAKVYVVETTLGDDSGDSDYNLGDDGLIVTDAQGRIVQ